MSKLDIYGKKYKVKQGNLESMGLCGLLDFPKQTIVISNQLGSQQEVLTTLLHECFHGINERLHIVFTNEFEEILVDSYAKFVAENINYLLDFAENSYLKSDFQTKEK